MSRTARIDVAEAEQPSPGEKFVISLQENSEMVGQLDGGRTFRFVSPSSAERDFQQQTRPLTIVSINFDVATDDKPRRLGSVTYTD